MLVGSAAFSINLASMKCWHMSLAISLDMVNVVVVVVVMILAGSLGSAERFDWENLREERLRHASSLFSCAKTKRSRRRRRERERGEKERRKERKCVSFSQV